MTYIPITNFPFLFIALSDTSFTKTVDDDEFSLDENEENEADTTETLLQKARKSVNIPSKPSGNHTWKKSSSEQVSVSGKRSRNVQITAPAQKKKRTEVTIENVAVNFLNSDKWSKEVRPPHLNDDDVFNMLSVESASQQIMNWTTTKAMMTSNELKESKATNRGGREKPDVEIKMIDVKAGQDDATKVLHKQRFLFRTPLQSPKEYWHLMPLKWKEVNKSLYLENVGMDNVCSPRTLELLHDRSSPLEIKMFLTLNISVGRAGISKKQNLRTVEDGTTEVVSSDDWLSPTSINQIMEALDNLVAIWTIMWPGEWSMVAMRRAITKHLAFGEIQNINLRKKMLEAFVNEVLTSNASLAARGKPHLEFEKLDKLATKYLENRRNFENSFKIEKKENVEEKPKGKHAGNHQHHRQELMDIRKKIGSLKSSSGNQICTFYNTTRGCISRNCKFEHACASVRADGRLCGGKHPIKDHK